MKVYTDCTCAPEGSELCHTGSGSGGRGSQWYFRKIVNGRAFESVGFERRWQAEEWAKLGWIKFNEAHSKSGSHTHEART